MSDLVYVTLAMNLIMSKESKFVSTEEALRDITSIAWDEEIRSSSDE